MYSKIVNDVQSLLINNNEWMVRYDSYAEKISKNNYDIGIARKMFHEWKPLHVYLSITNAKNATNYLKFQLRYLGQAVADLKANMKTQQVIIDTSNYDHLNIRDFNCSIKLHKELWDGKQASIFRKYFIDRENNGEPRNVKLNKRNEEHRIESLLISEFKKTNSKAKKIKNIRPVQLSDFRFPMTTPISASNHQKIHYAGQYGGGIDILARAGKGLNTELCIIELKDENTKKESPEEVLKQAVAYTTFIRQLLRSEKGEKWWELFGFNRKLPEKLVLNAVCAMPSNGMDKKSFANNEIKIDSDIIKLHYLYFIEDKNTITQIDTSLI
jgi:hypothetical protein